MDRILILGISQLQAPFSELYQKKKLFNSYSFMGADKKIIVQPPYRSRKDKPF